MKIKNFILSVVFLCCANPARGMEACPSDFLSTQEALKSSTPIMNLVCAGADYYGFVVGGLKSDESVLPTLIKLTDPKNNLVSQLIMADSEKGSAILMVKFDSPALRGTWKIEVEGTKGTRITAAFDAKPTKKFIFPINKMTEPSGQTSMYILSTGWEPSEELFAAVQMFDETKTDYKSVGKVNEFGASPSFKVLFNGHADGLNHVWLKNNTEQVELLVNCQNNICKEQDNLTHK